MPEITFWSSERINYSLLGQLALPGSPLGLMALCVFGFGFPIFSSKGEVFSEGFYTSFFLYFFILYREVFWGFI